MQEIQIIETSSDIKNENKKVAVLLDGKWLKNTSLKELDQEDEMAEERQIRVIAEVKKNTENRAILRLAIQAELEK